MQCPDLPKPRQGDFDGWPEVALPHRFDQVGQDAGVLGFVHELAIGVGSEDDHRHGALGQQRLRGLQAVDSRHFDVQEHQIRPQPAHQVQRARAVCRLSHHAIPLILQHRAQAQADHGLVVGDEDPQRVRHYSRALDAIRGTVITARVPAVPGAACCPAPPEKTSVPPRSSVTRARTIFNPRSVPAVGSNR